MSLLAKGAPVNWRNSRGRTALQTASDNNHIDVIKVLAQQDDIDVNVHNDDKSTPLHWACYSGHLVCVQILCATGRCDLGRSVCVSCDTVAETVVYVRI